MQLSDLRTLFLPFSLAPNLSPNSVWKCDNLYIRWGLSFYALEFRGYHHPPFLLLHTKSELGYRTTLTVDIR